MAKRNKPAQPAPEVAPVEKNDGRFKPGNPGGPGPTSIYSQELAESICKGLMDGMTLRAVCRQEGIDESTARAWAADPKHPFAPQYTRAREIGYHSMADELVDIADDGTNDWMEREGHVMENGEAMARSRLRVDTRKWLLSKALPKLYGDRIEQRFAGPDGEALPAMQDSGSDARKVAFMLGRAMGRLDAAQNEKSESTK